VSRLLLVEDHGSFRQTLAFVLGREADLEVIAQAGSLAEAREKLDGIDLAIIDIELPDGVGDELIPALLEHNPEAAVLVLTASVDRSVVARAVAAGAAGVVNKTAGIDEIIAAVRKASRGEPLLSAREAMDLIQRASVEREAAERARRIAQRLTPRERQILQLLADGYGNKEIAMRLHITVETQRTHMVNILSKLDAHSQLQALVLAVRHGIVNVS
jgi:DNA-binding NarL/FixJ family response regulator